jgi:hypothetical protein
MKRFRSLGLLPLVFFLAQAIHYWHINELGQVFWMCNIGNLLLAVGLFLNQRILIRVAAIWMVPGVAVWLVYVVPTWSMLLTGTATLGQLFGVLASTLAHLGGFSVGMLVLRRLKMDKWAWVYAFAWYFVVQLLSRFITPGPMNVNVSQQIQAGWEQTFSSYWKFWLVLTLLVGLCLWVLGAVLNQIWRAETDEGTIGTQATTPVSPSNP